MNRHGQLYGQITAFENLLLASRRAQRGKRFREDVLGFNCNLEENLLRLQEALIEERWIPGTYKTFVIYEPKRRLISAAPYADRVVHHAVCNVVGPLFERQMIPSSYANREGLGVHKALDHCRHCVQRVGYAYCLRADVEKYFPSVDHELLKGLFRRTLKCVPTLRLLDLIVDHSNLQEPVDAFFPGDELLTPGFRRVGIPIGNLTSQLWANVYLNTVDQHMAQTYGGKRYMRYVDDFALFAHDRETLDEARQHLSTLLTGLRLRLHPRKTSVLPVKEGVNFLGFRFYPERVRVRQENLRRARRRLRGLAVDFAHGAVGVTEVRNAVQSWNAHVGYGDTWRVREQVLDALVFTRA